MKFRVQYKEQFGNDEDGWDTFSGYSRVIEAESVSAALALAEAKCTRDEKAFNDGKTEDDTLRLRVSCEVEYGIGPRM